jgi:hypothetical protein
LLAILFLVACTNDESPPPDNDLATYQAATVITPPPYNDLGYGIYAGDGQNLCIPQFEEKITGGLVSTVSTSLISESSQIESSLKKASGWNIQLLGNYEFLVDEFEHHKARNEDFQVLMIVATVATAVRHLDPEREVDRQDWDPDYERMNLCVDNHPDHPENVHDFVTECGVEFVSSELKGGYAVLMADLTLLSTSQRREFLDRFDANVEADSSILFDFLNEGATGIGEGDGDGIGDVGGGYALDEVVEFIDSTEFGELRWISYQHGLAGFPFGSPPGDQDIGEWGSAQASDWAGYLTNVQQKVNAALLDTSTGFEDPRLGMHLGYATTPYHAVDLDTCDYSFSFGGIECAYDFHTAMDEVVAPNSWVQAQKAAIEHRLDHPTSVNWPSNDPQGAQDALADALAMINSCEFVYDINFDHCQEGLLYGSDAQACERCNVPPGCTYDELYDEIYGLPTLNHPSDETRQPEYHEVRQTSSGSAKYLAPVSTHACFLTGLRGKFVGGGEAVQVGTEILPNQGLWWTAEVSSQRTESSEHISGEYHCVERSYFEDDSGHGLQGSSIFDVMVDDDDEQWTEPYNKAIYPISGIRGALDGDGDFVRVLHRVLLGNAAFRVRADSDYIRADFQEYYLGNPHGGVTVLHEDIDNVYQVAELRVEIEEVLNRTRSRRLIPARDGFCFLSRVEGFFDGRGERVRVVAEDGYWYLRGASYPDKDLEIWSQCVRYDQMGY